jgi:hypothetical protein
MEWKETTSAAAGMKDSNSCKLKKIKIYIQIKIKKNT